MTDDFYGNNEEVDIPSESNYMKFQSGDNRFRILGSFKEGTAIQGIVYWKTIDKQRKPIRLPKNPDGTFPSVPASEIELNKFGEPDLPKYFWALSVYNYADKKVQILELKQKTILRVIKSYIDNPKWGDPKKYDIVVNQSEENGKTVYQTTVEPKEKLDEGIVKYYKDFNIDMEALFTGGDPFSAVKERFIDEVSEKIK